MNNGIKTLITIISIIALLIGCSTVDDKIDPALVKKDQKTLEKTIADSYSVATYKFIKICVRASVDKKDHSKDFKAFRSIFIRISRTIYGGVSGLSMSDYMTIYSNFKLMSDYINKTDEDQFPTFTDAANAMSGEVLRTNTPFLKGQEKIIRQNYEHVFLSVSMMVNGVLGKDILLYECSKTHPELIPDSETKSLFLFIRGFLFYEAELYYLSENEISQNITWLNNNPSADLPIVQYMFKWKDFDKEETHKAYLSLNHLFRGVSRIMMERDIDKQIAMEDFQIFVDNFKELGLDNELIWAIEAYLFIKAEDSDNAINALNKLRKSSMLSEDEIAIIDEAIGYLNDRDPDKALNGVYDRFYLGKIAVKYMYSSLTKVDWENLLEINEVPYVAEIFTNISSFTEFTGNLTQYTSGEALESFGNQLLDESGKLLDEGKDLLNETEEEIEDKVDELWDDAKELF